MAHHQPTAPDAIYAESFRIIEREVGEHGFSEAQWPIVRRMIHATGDLALAEDVQFTRGAAEAGIDALSRGIGPITDVGMVKAGLQRGPLEALGITPQCYIHHSEVSDLAPSTTGQTRSYHAMQKAIEAHGDAVYVIGNAPTALGALCEAVEAGRCAPPLIVALPVGFVSVAESKARALNLPVPVLAVRGRKGGSPVAAAAVNAMMRQALGDPA
jgi:precorrin-8X/cobalt-precorrin-8 methylmutase